MQRLAKKYGKTAEQIFFRFVRSQDIIFLTGTTSEEHMRMDLEAATLKFPLEESEIESIKAMLV